ncbi:Uncharacterized protein GBIM_15274 [Gryllus bimaculatus]|nr:Uncharacterized protein GBIM_15274 [Gryllus bimaculatus]
MWAAAASIVSRATWADWALLAAGLLLVLYVAGTWNYDHFQRQGVPSSRPKWPFLGDTGAAFVGGRPFFQMLRDQYEKGAGHGVYGVFEFTSPVLLIREPELLKAVAVKEFDSFTNHPTVQVGDADPIFSKNLFHLKDQDWRDMRATLSPAFTTSKIKTMFLLISECAQQMTEHLRKKYAESDEGSLNKPLPFDMKDLFSRMANDVIATAAFGVRCDSLKQPENEFYRMGKLITTISKLRSFILVGYMLFPKIVQWFGARLLDPKAAGFFDSLVHETIGQRRQQGIQRLDMLQLLMQAQEGKLKAEKEDAAEAEEVGASKTKLLLNEDVSAQAVLFFFAGFDTVSSALCLSTYVLSHHQNEQKRLYEEVAAVMEKTGGKPTYEAVQGMKYLDAVVSGQRFGLIEVKIALVYLLANFELLPSAKAKYPAEFEPGFNLIIKGEHFRMYPPNPTIDRVCQKDTPLPGTSTSKAITLTKGTIHIIAHYVDQPEKFYLERFNDENKHKIKPYSYVPFGRFALIEIKAALAHLLSAFDLHPTAKMEYLVRFKSSMNLLARGGFWCGLSPRESWTYSFELAAICICTAKPGPQM